MFARINTFILILPLMSACGGSSDGDGSGSNCDDALTVNYIQNTITDYVGFSESNTTIVHNDGNQGSTYDINEVAVSRISYDSNNSLAFSYTVYGTNEPASGTYIAFYLDTDKNAATGLSITGTMGADALVVNAPGGDANGFYLWDGIDSSWVKQSVLGSLASNASYFQGCTYSTTVYAPLYSGLSDLYGTDVTGIVFIVTIPASDPKVVTSILDASSQFDFTVP